MSIRIRQAIRDEKLREAILPEASRRAIERADRAIADDARIEERAGRGMRTPMTFNWVASSGQRQLVPRGGSGSRFGVHCTTTASGGPLVVRLTQEAETSGQDVLYEIYVPAGTRAYTENVSFPLLAGSWLSVSIVSSSGASGVSATLVANVG